MSRHNPGFEDRVRAFAARLTEHRTSDGTTQDIMAAAFGISRKTYVLLEQGRWLPGSRQGHHMVHTLHKLDPALAAAYAALYDSRVEDWGVAPPVPAAPPTAVPRLDPQHARHAYDAAVYAAAEEGDVPAKTLRPLVAAVLASLREAGMSLEQAAEAARAAVATGKPSRGGGGPRDEAKRLRVDATGVGDGSEDAEGEADRRRTR